MDPACLDHCLTEQERRDFERDGFLVVREALPAVRVAQLAELVDRIDAANRPQMAKHPHSPVNVFDFVGQDPLFVELLDWPKTFPKVWGLLGWHIQLYHSHVIITPPLPAGHQPDPPRLGWHQDSGRLNIDIESQPRPRISLKVAYFLTDCTAADRGNFHAVPGSQSRNKLALPADGVSDPPDAVPIEAAAGDAVFFDRRVWHAAGHNRSDRTRKVLFYGYSYRWLRPRDNMTVDHIIDRCDPIRQQLLGASPSGWHGYTSPKAEDVPLRSWIAANLGEEAVVP